MRKNIKITKDTDIELKLISKQQGVSQSTIIEVALLHYFKELESSGQYEK